MKEKELQEIIAEFYKGASSAIDREYEALINAAKIVYGLRHQEEEVEEQFRKATERLGWNEKRTMLQQYRIEIPTNKYLK